MLSGFNMDYKMSSEQRNSPRLPIKIEVEFTHTDTGVLHLFTKDLSDTGLFIKFDPELHPPIGTIAHVRLKNNFADGEEPPILEMEVVRHTSHGIGLKFIL